MAALMSTHTVEFVAGLLPLGLRAGMSGLEPFRGIFRCVC